MATEYLNLNLLFEKPFPDEFNVHQFNALVTRALEDLHGQVGAAIPVELLKYEIHTPLEYSAIVKLPKKELGKVWSALTLMGSYNTNRCSITVVIDDI